MAINLENGMFALHITRKQPEGPKVDGFAGTGTYADPYVLTLDGVPVPDADLTSAAEQDILWNGIHAGADKYNKFMLCAAMTTSRIHGMSISNDSGQLRIQPTMMLAPQGAGASFTDIRTEDIMSLVAADNYTALAEGGNYAPDTTIKNAETYVATRRPFVGAASVPFTAGKLLAGAQGLKFIKNMFVVDFLASAESTGIGACVIDMKLDYIGDNPEHSYTLLRITKDAASITFNGTVQYGPAADAETEDFTTFSSPLSPETGSVSATHVRGKLTLLNASPKLSATTSNADMLELAKTLFPGTGRLVYTMNYTGDKTTQAYLCPTSVGCAMLFDR